MRYKFVAHNYMQYHFCEVYIYSTAACGLQYGVLNWNNNTECFAETGWRQSDSTQAARNVQEAHEADVDAVRGAQNAAQRQRNLHTGEILCYRNSAQTHVMQTVYNIYQLAVLASVYILLFWCFQLGNLERKWQHNEQNNFVMKECILSSLSLTVVCLLSLADFHNHHSCKGCVTVLHFLIRLSVAKLSIV